MITYHIFLGIHILSAIAWLIAFVLSLFWAFRSWRSAGTDQEKHFMKRERRITSFGAHVGAVGILITGSIISSIGPSWGWFPFHLFTWLAVKQLVFIAILILVYFSVRKSMSFRRQIKGEGSDKISKQAREKWKTAYGISLAVYLLVVLNTILGSTKPF
jgi:uncharacterized membrane protein